MSVMFKPFKIADMEIPNRFMRSATWVGMATEDGHVTQDECDLMAELAQNAIGLVTSGHMAVEACGRARNRQMMIYDDSFVTGLKELVKATQINGAKVMAQISHTGNYGNEEISGETPRAVSYVPELAPTPRRVLTVADIAELEDRFTDAAVRAVEAGFDAVQLHCAHGYIFSQFLSPIFNKREDEYGGSIENRVRALTETIAKIKAGSGRKIPLLIKINSADFQEGGLTTEDMIKAVLLCQKAGLDAVELSGGLSCFTQAINLKRGPSRGSIDSPEQEAYFKQEAMALRKACDLPLLLVGGFRSFAVAESVIKDNIADVVSISRPFIREPDLVKEWHGGNYVKSSCISCNDCFQPGYKGLGVHCTQKDKGRR